MKISLLAAKTFVRTFQHDGEEFNDQPVPSDIISIAITRSYGLQTSDFTALRKSEYLKDFDKVVNKLDCSQRAYYERSIAILKKIDEDYNAAAKFAIVFCSLLETDQITDDKLDLFAETFLYMEKNQLPTDKYPTIFLRLAEDGATYDELTLFAHSAISLIQAGEPIDELVKSIDFTMSMYNISIHERKDFITSYCNQPTQDLTEKYETTVNKVARYLTYIPKAAVGIASKAALVLFG